MTIGWYFPEVSRKAARKKVESNALNSEQAGINQTLVREPGQNARDARPNLNENTKIKLRYSWVDFNNGDQFFIKYLDNLVERLKIMKQFDLKENFQFKPNFLVIEDFGTTGLTGLINPSEDEIENMESKGKFSNFDNYVMQIGFSGKRGAQGGRRGTGRATFNLASELRTQFVISNRDDDKKSVFIGICMGNEHRLNHKRYEDIGYYCDYRDEETPIWPITGDENDIKIFKDKLNLKRGNEPGTSVIIPYPIDQIEKVKIIASFIESYFFLINKNLLEVEFEDQNGTEILNKDNLSSLMSKYNLDAKKDLITFIDNCENDNSINKISLREESVDDMKINKEDFLNENDDLDFLKNEFNLGKIVCVKVPVFISKKDIKEKIKSYFEVFIQKVKRSDIQGKTIFIRNDMPLISEGKTVPKNVFGYMRVVDNELSTLLAHAEDVNHVKLEPNHHDLRRFYKKGFGSIIRTIKNSVRDIATLLLNIDDEDDITSFAEIFPYNDGEDKKNLTDDSAIDDDFDENEEDDDSDNKDVKTIPPINSTISPTKIVKIHKSRGIRVKANLNKEGIGGFFPMRLSLQIGYSKEGKRKSLKNYNAFDFDFGSEDNYVQIDQKDIEIIQKNKNIIEFRAKSPEFRLDIKNLLTDIYDLEVDLKNV